MKEYNNFNINQSWNPTSKAISKAPSSNPSNFSPIYPELKTTGLRTDHQRILVLQSRNGMIKLHGFEPPQGVRTFGVEFYAIPMDLGLGFNFTNISKNAPYKSCLYGCSALAEHSKQLVHNLIPAHLKKETTPYAS